MEFLGSELGTLARVVVALLVVLGLIALTFWLIRRFGPITLTRTGVARGRQPRLALLESATIDARRRLVLIRRDNVEHLLLVGGPTDVVVEPNIVRAAVSAGAVQQAPLPAPREPIARAAGRPAMLDPLDEHESSIVPPASPEPHVPTSEPAVALPPPPPPPPPAPESRPAHAPRIDPQYAEMAQRLEAALRRPPETRPVPPPPTAAHPSTAPARVEPRAPEPRPATMAPPTSRAPEPRMPKPSAPPLPVATAPAPPPPKPKRDVFDNLEEEMANLLGRGDNKKAG